MSTQIAIPPHPAQPGVEVPEGLAFDAFYGPLLDGFADRLRAALAALPDGAVELDPTVAAAGEDLAAELLALCSRTLVARFHDELREQGIDPDAFGDDVPEDGAGAGLPTEGYRRCHARLATPQGRAAVLAAAPVLDRLVRSLIDGRVRLLTEALTRFVADGQRGLLRAVGHPGRITAARVGAGDSHNGGRQVVVLHGRDGRLVYKPRSLATDALVGELVRELNPSLPDSLVLHPLTVCDRGDYGWQQFGRPAPCDGAGQVRRYFERIGIYLALFHTLGAGDLHRENVIAAGEQPLFVDLETTWTRRPERVPPQSAAELFQAELDDSVLSTMLLPARVVGSPFDMNNAGIGALGDQQSRRWSGFALVGLGSDALRFTKRLVQTRHGDNLVVLGDRPVDPATHADDVDRGFRLGRDLLESRRATLLAALHRAAQAGVGGRQVLRATALYGTFLEAASHPAYLADEADRARLLGKLGLQRPFGEVAPAVRQAEITALDAGDVPYFTSPLAGTGLRANETHDIAGAYPTTLLDDVRDTVGRRFARDSLRDRYLVHMSLLTGQSSTWDHLDAPAGRFGSHVFAAPDPREVARRIARLVDRLAVRRPGLRPVTWVTPLVDSESFCTLGPLNTSLYEGGGLLLVLAQLARADDDASLRDLVLRAVLDHPAWGRGELDLAGPAGFTGAAGAAYLLREMARELAEPRLVELSALARDAAVDRLSELSRERWDLVGGAAGSILALLAATSEPERAQLPRLIDGLAGLRSALPLAGPALDSAGAAHGGTGAVLAAARLARALSDDRLAAAAEAAAYRLAERLDEAALPPADAPTWCRGLAGDLPALGAALTELGVSAAVLRDRLGGSIGRLARLLERPVGTDLSLCHGEAGLAVAGQELDRLGLLAGGHELAGRRLRRAAAQAADRGYNGGLRHSAGLLTFMAGLSGFAHAALRDSEPGVGSALTFEPGGAP